VGCCNNSIRASQQRRIDEDTVLVDANEPAVYLAAIVWLRRRVAAEVDVAEEQVRTFMEDGRAEELGGALIAADLLNELTPGIQQKDAHLV
jgi:hypothetical protein